jgi:predicted Zn-ribbon and HTH transcriptional regulator
LPKVIPDYPIIDICIAISSLALTIAFIVGTIWEVKNIRNYKKISDVLSQILKQKDLQERHEILLNLCVEHLRCHYCGYKHVKSMFRYFRDLEEVDEVYGHYLKVKAKNREEDEQKVDVEKIDEIA